MKYTVLTLDPAWSFNDKLTQSDVKRGADSQYSTLSIDEIKGLKIPDLLESDGSIVCLWVPSSLLKYGLDCFDAWNIDLKQTYIWVKIKKEDSILEYIKEKLLKLLKVDLNDMLGFGMGRLFRQTHEICLIGINNTGIYKKLKNKSQRSVSMFFNEKHSKKPELLQDSLDIMFPDTNKIEIFARRERKGWDCLGNEISGEDIRVSIDKAILKQ